MSHAVRSVCVTNWLRRFAWSMAGIGGLCLARSAAGQSPPSGLEQQVTMLVQQLDAQEFARREDASKKLRALATSDAAASQVSGLVQKIVLDGKVSLETTAQLEQFLAELPQSIAAPSPKASRDDVKALIGQLGDDSFAVRSGAERRLRWLLTNPTLVCDVKLEVERRLSDLEPNSPAHRQLQPLFDAAREAWLTTDPAQWKLPPLSPAQIESRVAELADVGAPPDKHAAAGKWLLDVTARDEYRRPLQGHLAAAIAKSTDQTATDRLNRVVDWLKPAMVAEIWSNHRQVTAQHLLIGVPQIPEMAARATHFDRIDDQQAHCASGNTLAPGNYPVGIAIPHPEGGPMMFHLINLPTPRHRLAYEYQVKRSEAQRLRAISERTVKDILASRRHLSENELVMLAQLDARVVSRFIGKYFDTVPDQPLAGTNYRVTGQPTEHLALCYVMAAVGTSEAVPALEKVANRPRGDDDEVLPHQIAWLAALAIAERDPWTGLDDWLAGLVQRTDLLGAGGDPAPELGATAAAMLLARQQRSPRPFGLLSVGDPLMQRMGLASYRFTAPQKREVLLEWWRRYKQQRGTST